MQELIEFICLRIEEWYYVETGLDIKCMQEEELSCICIPGAVVNQAVLASSMFLNLEEVSVQFDCEDSFFYPAVIYKNEQLIGIVSRKKIVSSTFNLTGRSVCFDSLDGQLYIKLKDGFTKEEFIKRLREVSQNIHQRQSGEALGTGKFKLLMLAVKRFRLLKNKKELHLAFLALILFLTPQKTVRIFLKEITEDHKDKQNDIIKNLLDFFKTYADFLQDLKNEYGKRNDRVFVYQFGTIFAKHWGLYVEKVIEEYSQIAMDAPLEEVLTSSMKQNLQLLSQFVKCMKHLELVLKEELPSQYVKAKKTYEKLRKEEQAARRSL